MKKTKILFLTSFFLFVPFFIFSVNAEELEVTPTPKANRQLNREIKREEITTKKTEKFCSGLDTVLSKLTSNLEEKLAKVETNKSTRIEKYESSKEIRDENLLGKRNEWMMQREAHYGKLIEKATNDEQKQAIATYKNAIESAVKIRQSSVDTAVETYRTRVQALISSRERLNSSVVGIYKDSVLSAISTANNSCDNSSDLSTIKQQLRADLNLAKETLKNSIQKEEGKADLTTLKATRDSSIKIALDNYKTSIEKARADLKLVLGVTK